MKAIFISLVFLLCVQISGYSQNVGINTATPERSLEIEGTDDQLVRVQTTVGLEAGLELINGNNFLFARDWKLANNIGIFSIQTSGDNFASAGDTRLMINSQGNVGLRSVIAESRLHLNNGGEASNAGHGFMVIGTPSGINMVMDQNEINVRSNGSPVGLFLQELGGNTFVGLGGGNTYFGIGGGNVGIGTSSTPKKLSVEGTDFQVFLRNAVNGSNNWYIGASNSSWLAGDSKLLFSPGESSEDAVFRLMDVSDNDGENAPVIIKSSANQTLLIDGNEIDSRFGPLHINYNSNQNTYINPSGGSVGIGNANPNATLHIVTPANEYALRLQVDDVSWNLHPYDVTNQLGFARNGVTLANINSAGQWVALSDRNLKKDLIALSPLLDQVRTMGLYTYHYKSDPRKRRQFGVMAQEIESIFPQVVQHEDDTYAVSYAQLAVIALKALQEQQREIDALQNELNILLDVGSK